MPSKVSTPTSTEPDDQRARILASALDVLRTQGASGLTVRAVAKGAGCSTTGVYTWFGGKQGLVEAIFVDGFRSFDAALVAGFAAGDDLVAAASYRDWALANPTQYLVMFGGAVPGFEPGDDAKAVADVAFAHLVEWVAGRRDLGGAEARHEAMRVWATVHGYVMLELAGMAEPFEGIDPAAQFVYGVAGLWPDAGADAAR